MNSPFQPMNADVAISISDLKKQPNAVFDMAKLQAVAVLNHNRVVGYVISPEAWEGMLERLDDLDLLVELSERGDEEGTLVSLDDL